MYFRSFVVALAIFASVPASAGTDSGIGKWGTLLFENDAFGVIDKSDNDYSNGVAYDWGDDGYDQFEDVEMPAFLRSIFGWTYVNGQADGTYALDYVVSQGMFTPDDLSAAALLVEDRPYAGTLTWKARLRNYQDNASRSFGLTLGVVGPLSAAEEAQKGIHELIGAEMPNGWHNQIDNEPVFRLDGEYVNRFLAGNWAENLAVDTSLYAQAGLGNLKSNAGLGLVFRLGDELESTYAFVNPLVTRGSGMMGAPATGFSWQVQAAVYGQYVYNDITLDGNTFKDSHSVEVVHDQYIVSFGFSLRNGSWGFDFSTQQGSKQYEQQQRKSNFGSVSFSYFY